jgi:hypothetical protein
MLNVRRCIAMGVLGVGLAVAAAAPAKAQWFGWGGPYFAYARFPAVAYRPIRAFGYGCGCPRAYGAAYFPRFRYRPYAYAGYFPRYRFYRPYAFAGYMPMHRFYRPVFASAAFFPRFRFVRVARFIW